jgi:beta-glucosidase
MRVPEINPYSRNEYREGIFVGYRGYEKNGVKPLFPFGFGLSYTTFEYSDLQIVRDSREFVVSFSVKNTGKVAGAEVAQVYVTDDECSVIRPEKELKGFDKVYLEPGQTKVVTIELGPDAFRFFDEQSMKWKTEPGDFEILAGSASDDIRQTATATL